MRLRGLRAPTFSIRSQTILTRTPALPQPPPHCRVKPHLPESPGTFALGALITQDLPHKETQAAAEYFWVWQGWHSLLPQHPRLPFSSKNCSKLHKWSLPDVLPDISHFIMLEITTRKETFFHLNTVEVIYLTIKWGEKKSLLYRQRYF